MKLVPRDFFKGDRFFDDFWAPTAWGDRPMVDFFTPKVDVKDCRDHYEIHAELPGVKKSDIKVTLENDVLTLEAEVKQEDREEKDGKFIRQERRYGKLMRRFDLGMEVKEEEIEAKFKDGVLTLKAPKRDDKVVPEGRRITVH